MFGAIPAVVVGAVLLVVAIVRVLWVVARRPGPADVCWCPGGAGPRLLRRPDPRPRALRLPVLRHRGRSSFAVSWRWRIAYVVLVDRDVREHVRRPDHALPRQPVDRAIGSGSAGSSAIGARRTSPWSDRFNGARVLGSGRCAAARRAPRAAGRRRRRAPTPASRRRPEPPTTAPAPASRRARRSRGGAAASAPAAPPGSRRLRRPPRPCHGCRASPGCPAGRDAAFTDPGSSAGSGPAR